MKYQIKNKPILIQEVDYLSNRLEIPLFISGLMVTRGINSVNKTSGYLNNQLELFDPFLLKGMDKAVQRIEEAKKNKDKVYICGDYDVDGITSTAILFRFFKKIGIEVYHFLPTQSQGHGLSVPSVEEINKLKGNLIITVDNGSSSHEAVDKANELGINVIITDHHEIPKNIAPKAYAVLNPKQEDCQSPYKFLSGGGMALYLARAIAKKLDCEKEINNDLIILAAISTIADVAPLTGDNRNIVKFGLKNFLTSEILGLNLLLEKTGVLLENLSSRDIAFKISPLINAAGKFGLGDEALKILIDSNYFLLNKSIQNILSINEKRKDLVLNALPVVQLQAKKNNDDGDNILVVEGNHHSAINGLLAAKLTEQFNKPVIVFSLENSSSICRGSCRSIDGFNIQEAIESLSDCHLGGGGHYMAAGVSIKKDQIQYFKKRINEYFLNLENEKIKNQKTWNIDGELSISQLDSFFFKSLSLLEPFGAKNESPLVKINGLKITKKMNGKYNSSYVKLPNLEIRLFNNLEKDMGKLPNDKLINAIIEINFSDGQPIFILKDFETQES